MTNSSRRSSFRMALAVALATVMIAGPLAAQHAPTSPVPATTSATPTTMPLPLEIQTLDFNRTADGAGQLTVKFNREGAMVDLRTTPNALVLDIPAAALPPTLARSLDVADFATPVSSIIAHAGAASTSITVAASSAAKPVVYQAGNTYVLELARAIPQMPLAGSNIPALAKTNAQFMDGADLNVGRTYTGDPVTFNFQDVPVRTILQLIAEESGLNIVVSDTVSGNVTLRLTNVPWDQALDIVLRAKGLDKRRNGSVVWVAPQAELASYEQNIQQSRIDLENGVELQTMLVQVNYGNAEDLAALLSSTAAGSSGGEGTVLPAAGFLSPRGSLSADPRTNTLLVIDIPSRVEKIRQIVYDLDRPVDQVLIEARIVIATESFARELGAKFGIGGSSGSYNDQSSVGIGSNTDFSRGNARDRSNAIAGGDPSGRHTINNGLNVNLPTSFTNAGSLALSILNAGYMLDIELSALQQEGRGEVISNPRIVTSNQKEAVIRQGQEVGYVTISPSEGAVPIPNVQFKDVLLEMTVLPTITHDGRVFMELGVKKDEIEGFVDTSIGDVPTISKREITTAVLVEDGQTVVIGGVYEFRDLEDVSKVPFLADMPIIGNLFKSRGRSHQKAELLIFVTPKVMRVAPRPQAIPPVMVQQPYVGDK